MLLLLSEKKSKEGKKEQQKDYPSSSFGQRLDCFPLCQVNEGDDGL